MRDFGKWLKSLPVFLKALVAGSIVVQLTFLALYGVLAAATFSQVQKVLKPERAMIIPRQLPSQRKNLAAKPETKSESPAKETVMVTRVIDGDTIEVEGGRKVRYIGIDSPEEGRPYSKEAFAKNRELVEGKVVTLEKDVSEKDVFGRLLRYVYVGDTFVNAQLVEEGMAEAKAYPPDVAHEDEFQELEEEAKESGKGMWQGESFQNQRSFQDQQGQQQIVYLNEPGFEYHVFGCSRLGSDAWPVSLDEAKASGFKPCTQCNPPR